MSPIVCTLEIVQRGKYIASVLCSKFQKFDNKFTSRIAVLTSVPLCGSNSPDTNLKKTGYIEKSTE